jgi:threonine aldolase
MYSFRNDYSEGAHPRILELLMSSNYEANIGYGKDIHSHKAKEYIKKLIEIEDADIHFIPGGTQTNMLVISSFLRPHQCVISADTGHINVHETGAIEATGHKVVAMPCKDGKLTPDIIKKALDYHTDEHMVQPKMVYISNSTELGTIYSKDELISIHKICKENGLLLFLDGARLGSALTCRSNDLNIKDIANLVDIFYIGGTKNGALLGEALIILNKDLKKDFRFLIKQRGALAAKGFVLGIQFEALFQDNLYFELARHANEMAERLGSIIQETGYKFYAEPYTNQIFPIFPDTLLEKMEKEFVYEFIDKVDENNTAVRFVTSWATKIEAVEALKDFFNKNK